MASVYKRTDSPNWYAKFFDAEGKRVSRNTGTPKKREAEKAAAEMESEARDERRKLSALPRAYAQILERVARDAADGRLTLARAEDHIKELHRLSNPEYKVVSLSDHLLGWIEDQKPHIEPSTYGVYKDMHRHITGALGVKASDSPVGDLAPDQVKKAMRKLVDGGLKASTVNLDLRAFRRAMHAAVTDGLAKANVAVGIRPLPETDSVERAPFNPHEVTQLIWHARTRTHGDEWRGVILLGGHTGLRLGDVVKLSRGHIENGSIVIRPQKTKKSRKTIVIPISEECLEWIGERQGLFFPELSTKAAGTLSTTFKRIMESAQVPDKVTLPGGVRASRSFHSLRHSFTSWLAEADIPKDVRQKLTGHKDGSIHDDYTHRDGSLSRAIVALPRLTD